MARPQMVTRTIQRTNVSVMCLDTEIGECVHRDVMLPSTYKDEEAMLKEARKLIDTDSLKAVKVVYHTVETALYGMTQEKFLEHAEILPDRPLPNHN